VGGCRKRLGGAEVAPRMEVRATRSSRDKQRRVARSRERSDERDALSYLIL
jgi:hypothetical protein